MNLYLPVTGLGYTAVDVAVDGTENVNKTTIAVVVMVVVVSSIKPPNGAVVR